MLTFSAPDLTAFTTRVFQAVGAPDPVARRVAEALVDSNLVGHDSHGVIRIAQYLRDKAEGHVVPDAEPEVVHATPAIAVVDGHWAFGQVSAQFALEQATQRARQLGIGAAGLRHAWHVGRLGEYAERAANMGLVTHILCNSVAARVVPFGGREGRFATNPLAWGIPIPGRPSCWTSPRRSWPRVRCGWPTRRASRFQRAGSLTRRASPVPTPPTSTPAARSCPSAAIRAAAWRWWWTSLAR